MLMPGTVYEMYGWDIISSVRRLWVCGGPECTINPCIQISLWPSPRGDLSVADARAIKVSGHR